MTDRDRPHPELPGIGPDPLVPAWGQVRTALLDLASLDLEAGAVPVPTLFAFLGDEPQAMVTLRAVAPDELLQAFVEVLALLLPLGVDRIAYSMAERSEDFVVTAPRLVVVRIEPAGRTCRTNVEVLEGRQGDGRWRWEDGTSQATDADAGLAGAIALLLRHRDELSPTDGATVATQFARVLLLGHALALCPQLSRRLTSLVV